MSLMTSPGFQPLNRPKRGLIPACNFTGSLIKSYKFGKQLFQSCYYFSVNEFEISLIFGRSRNIILEIHVVILIALINSGEKSPSYYCVGVENITG